jgi:hypothetical protein
MWNKLAALLQWFVQLELQEHRHWCSLWEADGRSYNPCQHRTCCWMCTGIFCVGVERKDCLDCVERHAEQRRIGVEASRVLRGGVS